MSEENAQAVRRLYEGWMRGDFAVAMDAYSPDVVLVIDYGVFQGTATGIDEMREMWRDHLTLWDSWTTGPIEELIQRGDRVVVAHSLRGRSKRGLTISSDNAGAAFFFRDGRIVRIVATGVREQALEAAGLSE